MPKQRRKRTILWYFGYSIAVFLCVVTILFSVRSLTTCLPLIGKPFPGFFPLSFPFKTDTQLLVNGSYVALHAWTLPHWTGKETLKYHGRRFMITRMDGRIITQGKQIYDLVKSEPAGTMHKYTITDNITKIDYTLKIPSMIFTWQDYYLIPVILFFVGMFFFLSGAFIFFLKPNRIDSWGILVVGLVISNFSLMQMSQVHTFNVNEIFNLPLILYNRVPFDFMAFSMIHLVLSALDQPEFLRKEPWRYVLIYLYAVGVIIIRVFDIYGFHLLSLEMLSFLLTIQYPTMAAASVFALLWLFKSRYFSTDPIVRQRARILLLGSSVLFIAAIVGFGSTAMGNPFNFAQSYVAIFSIALPIALVYGSLRSNLFEVDEIVKQSIFYGFVILITAIVYGVIWWGLSRMMQGVVIFGDQQSILITLILFILVIPLLKRQIQSVIDRMFFRTRADQKKVFSQIKDKMMFAMSEKKVVESAESILVENLLLEKAEVLLYSKEKAGYYGVGERAMLLGDEVLVALLKTEKRLISSNELISNPNFSSVSKKCMAEMARLESIFVMPVMLRDEITGILALGGKKTGDITFNLVDIAAIKLIANQTASALEKARMYREIEDARKEFVKLNAVLEDRVKLRTGELQAKIEALNIANDRIAAATRHKSEFLASMSHELRTPLSGIIMYTELVLGGIYEEVNEEVREVLRDMHYNGKALLQLINDLLDFSKLEAGKLKVSKEEFSPREAVDHVAIKKVGEAKKKKLELIGEFEKDLPLGMGDSKRVVQVVESLVGNAIKFSKAGKVVIRVKWESEKRILIQVEDTGIGIPKDRLTNIFNEFEQLESPLIKEYKGVGLGLALSKRLVELQGGEMEVESEVGKGSRFSILIPVKEERVYEAKPRNRTVRGREKVEVEVVEYNKIYEGREEVDVAIEEIRKRRTQSKKGIGKKILSIEDNPSNQKIISDMLIDMGYQVIEAKNGMEGLEKLISEKPDLVITDVQMPRLDGMTLIKTIRKEKQPMIRGIPIIISSASVLKGDIEKGLAAGADAYITKPFKFSEMINVVKKCLGEEEK